MPRMLALDWTRHEARYVLANSSKERLTIIAAGAVPLSDLTDEEYADPQRLGAALRDGLSSAKVGRGVTLIGVERARGELLEFTIPEVPASELPQMVLNLAMRESSAVSDDSTVDFIATPGPEDDTLSVAAIAFSAGEMKRLQQTCDSAKLTPDRVVLRAFSTAALLPALPGVRSKRCLIVNRIGDEADLTVVDSDHVVFSRTVRLPGDELTGSAAQRLLQEIRRTMMVAPHGKNGHSVDAIYLLGREFELSDLLQSVRDEFGTAEASALEDQSAAVDIRCFDIFAALDADDEIVPADSGRYAPLLGMLYAEGTGGAHSFDLLNPRKPPKPPDRRRRLALYGGVAAAAILMLAYPTVDDYFKLVDENDQRAKELKEKKKSAKTIKKQKEIADAIAGWEGKGVNWLEELENFSQQFPSARDAMVLRMTLGPSRGARGAISFNGLARHPEIVTQMELSLRDDGHEIQTPRVQEREQENGYTWQFESKMELLKPKEKSDKEPKTSSSKKSEADTTEKKDTEDPKEKGAAQKSQQDKNNDSAGDQSERDEASGGGASGEEQ